MMMNQHNRQGPPQKKNKRASRSHDRQPFESTSVRVFYNDDVNMLLLFFTRCGGYRVACYIVGKLCLVGFRHRDILLAKHDAVAVDEPYFCGVYNKRAMHPQEYRLGKFVFKHFQAHERENGLWLRFEIDFHIVFKPLYIQDVFYLYLNHLVFAFDDNVFAGGSGIACGVAVEFHPF